MTEILSIDNPLPAERGQIFVSLWGQFIMSPDKGGTTIARNKQIGGHRAGDDNIQLTNMSTDTNTETESINIQGKAGTVTQKFIATKVSTRRGPNPRIIYADIIDMPHHQSSTRAHMSLHDRAAQFNPFAALSGYDEMISDEIKTFETQT